MRIVRPPQNVQFVPLSEARELVTIDSESDVWEGAKPWVSRGAIVRIRPPHDATQRQIDELTAACIEQGAERVRVEARQRAPKIVASSQLRPAKSSIREVVNAMCEEANSRDRQALLSFASDVMDRVGI
jgi:hypothetical protein